MRTRLLNRNGRPRARQVSIGAKSPIDTCLARGRPFRFKSRVRICNHVTHTEGTVELVQRGSAERARHGTTEREVLREIQTRGELWAPGGVASGGKGRLP